MTTSLDLLQQLETPNLGVADCLLRIAAGLLLTGLAIDGTIGPWGYAGLLSLATGAAWVCPVYRLLGLSTVHRFTSDQSLAARP